MKSPVKVCEPSALLKLLEEENETELKTRRWLKYIIVSWFEKAEYKEIGNLKAE